MLIDSVRAAIEEQLQRISDMSEAERMSFLHLASSLAMFQANQQQTNDARLMALVSHRHDPQTGKAIFGDAPVAVPVPLGYPGYPGDVANT